MNLLPTTSKETCILNYGFDDNGMLSGTDMILEHDHVLELIEKGDKQYSFVWFGQTPTSELINDDIAQFLMYHNVTAVPNVLNKLNFENLTRIYKKRPDYIVEELGNIFGNLRELSSDKSASLMNMMKDDIKTHDINNVKPGNGNEILLNVNGIEKKGKFEYGRANDGSIKINFDIKLTLDDIIVDKNKSKSRKINIGGKDFYDVTYNLSAATNPNEYIYLLTVNDHLYDLIDLSYGSDWSKRFEEQFCKYPNIQNGFGFPLRIDMVNGISDLLFELAPTLNTGVLCAGEPRGGEGNIIGLYSPKDRKFRTGEEVYFDSNGMETTRYILAVSIYAIERDALNNYIEGKYSIE